MGDFAHREPHRRETGLTTSTETLTVTDNRTGNSFEIPITDDTIRATDLRQIKVNESDFGMMTYDPAFMNTASCRSAITFLDGDAGVLQYRGYPIEQLAADSNFMEVAYLLLKGELPSKAEYDAWLGDIRANTPVDPELRKVFGGFGKDAHPMMILMGAMSALGSRNLDWNIEDQQSQYEQVVRITAQVATLGAWAHRVNTGRDLPDPDPSLGYTENFLTMLNQTADGSYKPDPRLVRAMDVLFILHGDHEQNCSTSAVRSVGSSQVDPYSAVVAGLAALFGPLHGGANEAVLRMLRRIEKVENIPAFIEGVKAGKERLMGFGHRVYKNFDPRATIIKKACDEVFEVTGVNPLLAIAVELEKVALSDEYFIKRKLYPNVDFYSGLIYEAMGLPAEMFTVLFAIGRTPGWVAQWYEMINDKEQKISRPRQVYIGSGKRDYVGIGSR
ncbi:MAG: citrate synthase [Thermoleophilia bacterium]